MPPYTYAANDPVGRFDPTGHFDLTAALITVAIIAVVVITAYVAYRQSLPKVNYHVEVDARIRGVSMCHEYRARITSDRISDIVVVQWVKGRQLENGRVVFESTDYIVDDGKNPDEQSPADSAVYPGVEPSECADCWIHWDCPGWPSYSDEGQWAPGEYENQLDFIVNVYQRSRFGPGGPRIGSLRSPRDPKPLLSRTWRSHDRWTFSPGGRQ